MTAPEFPIALQNIAHAFDGKPVLSNISLYCKPGSITAVLGKSGSGKSTLLQIMNGLLRPDRGEVYLSGQLFDYQNAQATRLKIGYVVQQLGLFPHMTIEENISLLGKISNKPPQTIRARVDALLSMVDIPASYLKKYPYQLSGGEQQRAELCRAMLMEPAILLMDEPFSSLDYVTKHGIYKHLLKIQQTEPRTIVMVTHDWEEARILADEVVWLDKGVIKSMGDKSILDEMKTFYLENV